MNDYDYLEDEWIDRFDNYTVCVSKRYIKDAENPFEM